MFGALETKFKVVVLALDRYLTPGTPAFTGVELTVGLFSKDIGRPGVLW